MKQCLAACLLVSALVLCQTAGVRPAWGAQPETPETPETPGAPPAIPAQGQTPAAEPPASFHGIAWGTPLADVKDMTVVEKNGPAAYAKVTGLSPRIADVAVTEIVYAFCNGLFSGAMATFRGQDRLEAIREVVAKRYGPPVVPGDGAQAVGWPLGDVMIMLEFDAPIGVGVLSYLHAPTYAPCAGAGEQAPPAASPATEPQAASPTAP